MACLPAGVQDSAAAEPASEQHAGRDGPAHGPFPLLALVPGWGLMKSRLWALKLQKATLYFP